MRSMDRVENDEAFSHSSHRPLEIVATLPHFHRHEDTGMNEFLPKNSQMRWGQFRRAKGAKSSRQNHNLPRIEPSRLRYREDSHGRSAEQRHAKYWSRQESPMVRISAITLDTFLELVGGQYP